MLPLIVREGVEALKGEVPKARSPKTPCRSAARLRRRFFYIQLLESARTYQPKREVVALLFAYPLLATFLLTGGRRAEVLGLEVDDVSFDRKTVTFRPNCWRRLKTPSSFRTVPLWAQLEDTLQPYVFGDRPPSRLLFPSYVGGREAMLVDFRKLIDAVATRAGWHAGAITSKIFRHTYCAARLQTLDQGAPVSVYTVAKELGHGGEAMVRRVYRHLGTVHRRSEVVEYRVEQHVERLRERLEASGLGPRGAIPGRSSQRAWATHPLFPQALLQKLLQQAG